MCEAADPCNSFHLLPRSKNEEVELNFGTGAAPFVFDLDQLVRSDRERQGRAVHGCAAEAGHLPSSLRRANLVMDTVVCSSMAQDRQRRQQPRLDGTLGLYVQAECGQGTLPLRTLCICTGIASLTPCHTTHERFH